MWLLLFQKPYLLKLTSDAFYSTTFFTRPGQDSGVYQEDPGAGLFTDWRIQQVQEHDAQATLQAAREGAVGTQEVQPRQQEGSRSGSSSLLKSFTYA